MLKNLLAVCLELALLSACLPSADIISTAIAQTQAAAPTSTRTSIPLRIVIETRTPMAPRTAVPTSTPRPPLAGLLVNFDTIETLWPGYYSSTPLPMTGQLETAGADRAALAFTSDRGAGTITVLLVRLESSGAAADQAMQMVVAKGGVSVVPPMTLTDRMLMVRGIDPDDLTLVMTQGEVVICVNLVLGGATDQNAGWFVAHVGKSELEMLSAAGY